jgi:HNH endonuclease
LNESDLIESNSPKLKIKIKKPIYIHEIYQPFKTKAFYKSREWKILRTEVLKRQKECHYCKTKKNLQVDHIKPRSRYPHLSLNITNLQTLCKKCNLDKGDK